MMMDLSGPMTFRANQNIAIKPELAIKMDLRQDEKTKCPGHEGFRF